MSLPPLLKHVYNYGTEEVIRRGKRIFHTSGVQMLDVDHLLQQVRFRVRNDVYQNYYTVTINKFNDTKDLSVRCQCPYNLGEICRHEVAALFQLNEIIQTGFFDNTDIVYNQKHTIVRMKTVSEQMVTVFSSAEIVERARMMAKGYKAVLTGTKTDTIEADVPDPEDEDKIYKIEIKQNEERYFDTSCGCSETKVPLCVHKAIAFLQVLYTKGVQHFTRMQNWDVQKNKLLEQYGYSLKDNLSGKFEWTYQDGKPFLRVLDTSIKKLNAQQPLKPAKPEELKVEVAVAPASKTSVTDEPLQLGIVLDTAVPWYPFVQFQLVAGHTDKAADVFKGPIEKLDLLQYVNAMRYRESDRTLLPVVRKFLPEEILKYLKKNLPFGDFLDDFNQVLKEDPAPEIREQVWEYLLPKYQRMLERYSSFPLTFIREKGKTITAANLQPVRFSQFPVKALLHIEADGADFLIKLQWQIGAEVLAFREVEMLNPGLVLFQDNVYAINNLASVPVISALLPDGVLKVTAEEWPEFLDKTVMAWRQLVTVDFDEGLIAHSNTTKPALKLFLQERDRTLVMIPAFNYEGMEIKWGYVGDVTVPLNGKVNIIHRHERTEQEFIEILQGLHPEIKHTEEDHFFYLPAEAVLANTWFFRFLDKMKEHNVSVLGFNELKKLRISTYRPETKVQVSSGIDWFDTKVEVAFGDQVVSIADVKKALAHRNNYVQLADGSIGLLPEEWMKKYALLVKMGEAKDGKLRLKKFHFSVLDELLSDVDEQAVLDELEQKKGHLADIIDNDFSNLTPPAQLKATLRPYQQAGFQWMAFLREAGWGGILADDMGLGKTVQTLTFFQYYFNEHPGSRFMVVCPTTLMYNWEAEIKKFTPGLRHFIHHGPKRTNTAKTFDDYDVVITTYGTMRSDIKIFKEFEFDYIVLDESQAIKNPQSQVAKAAILLNAKNRLALSGTPVQNNTFDLYAQMNFLNPGMLGSREFFMNEFATPIDKFGEEEIKKQLRKLTYPFMLRRTKEQVAKDLPEKTTTVLYCEMGADQRKIYNSYRVTYKDQIMNMIDERGIERSQMHILSGLTKLRQICDSPAILNEDDKFPNHSVKQDELMREIMENVGNHKALVFSQFLGMLALIRKALEEQGIQYAYFDGGSSSTERERAIQNFQNNEECRVFLISLKAGGVGLNLTAADYVYIVDPWWNPAVEQQAIDRTHRIGQTKSIFAYRLICKDTIEEKMLLLQERKRALATDLVADDSAFMKKLTRDDIAFLLS
jgi:superfamily II DNA or RNA helicase